MAVRKASAGRVPQQNDDVKAAIWAALLALALLFSPLAYDAWRLFGGS